MSPSIRHTSLSSNKSLEKELRELLSKEIISFFACNNCKIRLLPTNPVPPVTKILAIFFQ